MPKPFPSPLDLVGIFLIGAGIAIDLWSIRAFLTLGRGTPAYILPPKRVVTKGPYAHVRNPMYLSLFLTLLGLGILFDAVLVLVIAFVSLLILHFVIVLPEEARLEMRFGEEYGQYKKRVPRWVPNFKSRPSDA